MGFILRKRINLGKGFGINISKSGLSASKRTKFGTYGTKGFSSRTGIPGLSYRKNWGKSGCAPVLMLFFLVIVFFITLACG